MYRHFFIFCSHHNKETCAFLIFHYKHSFNCRYQQLDVYGRFSLQEFSGFSLFCKQTPLFVKMQSRNTTISLPSHMMYRQGFSVTDIIDNIPFIVYNLLKKFIPSCTAGILPGLYHGEFSINNPDRYVGCVRSIINKAE